MHSELRRSLLAPVFYWRTVLLVMIVGLMVTTLIRDMVAVLLSSVACAFVFSSYERRRWVVMPTELQAGDVVARLAIAFVATLLLHSMPVSPVFDLLARS